MRIDPRSRHVAIVVLLLLAGCSREPAAPVAAPAPVLTDKQAIEAATAVEREYQAALAKGDLSFLDACKPGRPDSIRLVDVSPEQSQGYSLAISADPRGAVAIWQGLQYVGKGAYQSYGSRGMRLDVNGWRQLYQAVTEPAFASKQLIQVGAGPPTPAPVINHALISLCLDGKASLVRDTDRFPDGADAYAFERVAVAMRRLAGNYYSPPTR